MYNQLAVKMVTEYLQFKRQPVSWDFQTNVYSHNYTTKQVDRELKYYNQSKGL